MERPVGSPLFKREIEILNDSSERTLSNSLVHEGDPASLEDHRSAEERGQSLENFPPGEPCLFLPGRLIDEIEPPALVSLKLKNRFFENEAAPSDRSPENGKNPYPQNQPFRSKQIKGLRPIFDADLLKGHSHPWPEARGGFPNERPLFREPRLALSVRESDRVQGQGVDEGTGRQKYRDPRRG